MTNAAGGREVPDAHYQATEEDESDNGHEAARRILEPGEVATAKRRALAGLAGDAELAVNSESTSLTPAPMSFDGRIGPA